MTSIRVTSMGPSALLGAAMIPVPAPWAGAWQARGLIHGCPRRIIPAPRQGGLPQDQTALAIGGHDSRTSDAPPVWATSIYFLYGRQAMTPHVSITSDNQMPVPAEDPRGIPITAENSGGVGQSPSVAGAITRARIAGQGQVRNPRAVQRFPDIMSRIGRRR